MTLASGAHRHRNLNLHGKRNAEIGNASSNGETVQSRPEASSPCGSAHNPKRSPL